MADRVQNPAPQDNNYFRSQPVPTPSVKLALVKRITTALTRFLAAEQVPMIAMPPEGRTTETGASDAAYTSFNNPLWRITYDRKAVYFDLKDMDLNDPLIASALDVHADCAVGYEDTDIDGFEWLMEAKNPKAMKVLQDMKQRLDLGAEAWQIVRSFVKYGEDFREIVTDENGIIGRFKHLPSYQIMPKLDQFGNKQPGWTQRLDGGSFIKPIEFDEWQIVAFVYGAKRGWYGTGLMMPARRTWKRLSKMEDGMVLARLIRAYDKHLHRVPVKSDWDERKRQEIITNYKMNMTKRKGMDDSNLLFMRENPLQVETDFYIPDDGTDRGGIEVLQATNMQLQQIDDVRYHQELLLSRLKVPKKYLNLSSGKTGALMDGGLESEDKQFARTLRQEQAVLRSGLLRLAHIALFLQGFDPDELGVGINLPKISTSDMLTNAKIQLAEAQAASFLAQAIGGPLPPELIAQEFMDLRDEDKEILSKFVYGRQEDERQFRDQQAKTASSMGGSKPAADDESSGADPDDVVQAVTRLKMKVQRVLEQRGYEFNVGWEENRNHVRNALLDTVLLDKELGL